MDSAEDVSGQGEFAEHGGDEYAIGSVHGDADGHRRIGGTGGLCRDGTYMFARLGRRHGQRARGVFGLMATASQTSSNSEVTIFRIRPWPGVCFRTKAARSGRSVRNWRRKKRRQGIVGGLWVPSRALCFGVDLRPTLAGEHALHGNASTFSQNGAVATMPSTAPASVRSGCSVLRTLNRVMAAGSWSSFIDGPDLDVAAQDTGANDVSWCHQVGAHLGKPQRTLPPPFVLGHGEGRLGGRCLGGWHPS